MTVTAFRCAPVLLLLAMLVACGGGDGGGGSGGDTASDADYFPYTVGNRWGYQTLYTVDGAPQAAYLDFLKVSNTADVDGEQGFEVEESNACGVKLFTGRYLLRKDGMYYADGSGNGSTLGIGTYKIASLPIRDGNRFYRFSINGVDYGSDVDGDGRNETITAASTVTVGRQEDITVPAGSFADCVLLQTDTTQTLMLSASGTQLQVAVQLREWYARGIGAVKRIYQATGQGSVETREFALESYYVDGSRREATAPEILSSQPSGSFGPTPSRPISVRFNEDIDPSTISTSSFHLANAAGSPIPGRVTYADRVATFFPSIPLGSASYTATVTTGVEDLSGNALVAPYSWNFTLDATSPEILETFPPPQATGISSNTALTVKFSEEILPPASFPYFTLRDALGTLVNGTVTFSQREVTFTPASALAWGKTYTATIPSTLQDVYGNQLPANFSWSFTVEPGLFAPYSTIQTGSWTEAVAIGDVNGDGRNDIALVTSFASDPVNDYRLFVFYQDSDGTLLPAAKYLTGGSYTNRPTAVTIGDVNHDGRSDIVVGIAGIGIEVFLQNASGTLAPKTSYTNVSSSLLKIADMNGDGLQDVIGGGAAVSVLFQRPDGTLAPPAVTALVSGSFVNDLKISDVNNDGLPDAIIVNQKAAYDIGLLLQSPAGGLSSPTYISRPIEPYFVPGGIAVADVNADSVADLIVSNSRNRPLATIGIFEQNASGQYGMTSSQASYDIPQQLEIGDLNGDGLTDIAVQHQGWNAVGVYLQGVGGGLLPEQLYGMASFSKRNPQSLAIGDINGDSLPDIAIAGAGLNVLYNSGAPTAAALSGPATASPQGATGVLGIRDFLNVVRP